MRPHLVRAPADTTVLVGDSVDLACQVTGDPPPSVYWSRQNDRMPVERINVLTDKTMRIEQVRPQDEGTYVCEADNIVGSVTASATVTVHCEFCVELRHCLMLISVDLVVPTPINEPFYGQKLTPVVDALLNSNKQTNNNMIISVRNRTKIS